MNRLSIFILLVIGTIVGCGKDTVTRLIDTSYQPDVSPSRFPNPTNITNPYYPVGNGQKYIYEGQSPDGLEHIEEQRLNITRVVNGITCVVVNFKAFIDGKLVEEADDWYAQDVDGNVWYFGEDVNNYNPDGTIKDHGGSWEAGIDGAKPGLLMPANPVLGMSYREEYYFNEAEDEAEITGVNLTVTVPYGTFTNCIRTHNFTELEPDLNEEKFYASGIGFIKEIDLTDNFEIVLISIE